MTLIRWGCSEMAQAVCATVAALEVIERLRAQYGPLMFFQSGSCRDGSSPMCILDGEPL